MTKSLIFSLTLTGTLVGAGFATGQEMLSFFVMHNPKTPIYFIGSSFLLFLCIFFISKRNEKSAKELYISLFGKLPGKTLHFISLISLFICYGACLTGMGSVFFESFSLSYFSGALLLSAVSFGACIFGMKGINILNAILTPFIIISVLIFATLSAIKPQGELMALKSVGLLPFFYAFLYTGYNIFPLIPVSLTKEKTKAGVFIAFIFTALCGTAMFYSLSRNPAAAFSSQIPFENIIRILYPRLSFIYSFTVASALATTGASCLFGFVSAMEERFSKIPLYIFCFVISFVFLLFGLSGTVRIFYPLSGIAGTALTVRLIISGIFNK